MKLANKITASRLPLTFFFLIFYFFSKISLVLRFDISDFRWTIPILWILMLLLFISDELDGFVARKRNETSSFGERFDAFTDYVLRISYGFCFGLEGILLLPLILVSLFRDQISIFIVFMMRRTIPTFMLRSQKPFISKCYYVQYFGYAVSLLIYSCGMLIGTDIEWQSPLSYIANISFGIGSIGMFLGVVLFFLHNRKAIMNDS
jgi:phosphatidylglycerophosphate synthase